MDYTLYQLLWFFLIYAFLGWLMETALAAVRKRRLLNRGFLNAPFSPVYGLAAVLFAIFLPELRSAPFFLFLGGMILATGLELSTGLLLERISHQKWWDYSDEPWNFNGHICLKYSLVWGLLALLCVFFLNPLLVTLTGLLPRSVGKWILLAVLILLGLDFLGSWAALLQLKGSLGEPGQVSRRWKRLSDALDNAVTRYIQRRMARAYPSLEREQLRRGQRAARAAQEERPHVFAAGCGFYKLACLFFLGSFLGDVTETIFCRLTTGVWMSRSSVVYGPFSLVWGFGAVLLTAILCQYRSRRDGFSSGPCWAAHTNTSVLCSPSWCSAPSFGITATCPSIWAGASTCCSAFSGASPQCCGSSWLTPPCPGSLSVSPCGPGSC